MKQLFIVLLGGKHPRASIEVHDIIAATGEQLSDTHGQLKQHWFGSPEGLHIDAWMQISGADGYQLHFSDSAPAPDEPRLYLINLGGYLPEEFGEAHRYVLVTARTPAEAKHKGKQQLLASWHKPHTDAVIDVDACLPLDFVNGAHIHLKPGPHAPPYFENDYLVIG
jgi:hypothetical protein